MSRIIFRASLLIPSVFILFIQPGCSFLANDNFAEELIEDAIQEVTGLDIDLTSEDGK